MQERQSGSVRGGSRSENEESRCLKGVSGRVKQESGSKIGKSGSGIGYQSRPHTDIVPDFSGKPCRHFTVETHCVLALWIRCKSGGGKQICRLGLNISQLPFIPGFLSHPFALMFSIKCKLVSLC